MATEWRFYLVTAQRASSFLPDVAYIPYERLARSLPEDARERPRVAPDIAVEIWSADDRPESLAEKIAVYLANGARLVMLVYSEPPTIVFHLHGQTVTHVAERTLQVPGLDDLVLGADALFRNL